MKSNLFLLLNLIFIIKCSGDNCYNYDQFTVKMEPKYDFGGVRVHEYNDSSNTLHLICAKYWPGIYIVTLIYEDKFGIRRKKPIVREGCINLYYPLNLYDDGAKIKCSARKRDFYNSYLSDPKDEMLILKYDKKNVSNTTRGKTSAVVTKDSGTKYEIWIGVGFGVLLVGILGAFLLIRFRKGRHHQITDFDSVEHENSIYEESPFTGVSSLEYTKPFDKEHVNSFANTLTNNIDSTKVHIYAQPILKRREYYEK